MKFGLLTHEGISAEKLKNSTGVYILAKAKDREGKYLARYVGRSVDLDTRLKSHAKNYKYFGYELFDNEHDAYLRELKIYKSYSPPDNLIAPVAA